MKLVEILFLLIFFLFTIYSFIPGECYALCPDISQYCTVKPAGLGTAFFYVLIASFFCVLLKNATFFYILFRVFSDL